MVHVFVTERVLLAIDFRGEPFWKDTRGKVLLRELETNFMAVKYLADCCRGAFFFHTSMSCFGIFAGVELILELELQSSEMDKRA